MNNMYIKGYYLNTTIEQFGEEKVVYLAYSKEHGYRNFLPGQQMYSPTAKTAAQYGSFKLRPSTALNEAKDVDSPLGIVREYEAQEFKLKDLK